MADAAVGGKTAIDIPAARTGRRVPFARGVLADLITLETLPRADYVSGLAEVIKPASSPTGHLDLVRQDPQGARSARRHARELIERAIRVKAEVVSQDLTEKGGGDPELRAHARARHRTVEGYRFRHGDAVAIGMVYVAELARLAGRLDEPTCQLHRPLLASVGLPTAYPRESGPRCGGHGRG